MTLHGIFLLFQRYDRIPALEESMDKMTDDINRKLLNLRPRLSSSSSRLLSPTRPGLSSTLGSGTRARLSSASRRSWPKALWPRLTRSLTTPRCSRGFWTRALLMSRVCFHDSLRRLSYILILFLQESCRKPNRSGSCSKTWKEIEIVSY